MTTAAVASMAGPLAAGAAAMEVVRLPVLSDNYVWLLHEPSSGQTAVVDPAVHEPVLEALQERWAAAGRAAGTCCMAAATAGDACIAASGPACNAPSRTQLGATLQPKDAAAHHCSGGPIAAAGDSTTQHGTQPAS
jgi:hypothetical protein